MGKNKRVLGLILVGLLIITTMIFTGCTAEQQEQGQPKQDDQAEQEMRAEYVGSKECSKCHSDVYEDWEETFHARSISLKDDDEDNEVNLVGDFSVGKLSYKAINEGGKEVVPITLNEEGTVTIGEKDYEIVGTYGGLNEWKERYMTRDVENPVRKKSLNILPIQWNQKTEKWVPYHADKSHGEPSLGNWWRSERTFEKKCAGCHNTGLKVKANDDGYVTDYSYSELNTGCENCHGPGSQHIESKNADDIINPADLSKKRANEVCGACHSRGSSKPDGIFGYPWDEKKNVNGNYTPGQDLTAYYSEGGGYYGEDKDGDGRVDLEESVASKKHHQQWPDVQVSTHYKSDSEHAPTTCSSCHNPHNDGYEVGDKEFTAEQVRNNKLCLDCHQDHSPFNGEEHHFGDSEYASMAGTSCVSCHMTKTSKSAVREEESNLGDIHSHRLEVYPPSYTDIYQGMPNSCIQCHDNATDEMVDEIEEIVKERNQES